MNQYFKPKRQILTPVRFMVVFVILLVIVTVVLPELAKPDRARPHIVCRNKLQQLGIAFRGFGIDQRGFPLLVDGGTNSPVNQ